MKTNVLIQNISGAPLQFETALPVDFKGLILAGAKPRFAEGPFGTYFIQELRDEFYCIHYCVLQIRNKWAVRLRSLDNGLFTRIVIKSPVMHNFDNGTQLGLSESEFSRFPLNGNGLVTEYAENTKCIHFDTYFSKNLVDELRSLSSGDLAVSPVDARTIDATTRELIDSILYCHYKDDMRRHFFNSRVKDLLFQFMVQWNKTIPITDRPTDIEIAAVHAAERMISDDISRHLIIPELAKKVHLSEFRFKIVFKKIFGAGAYEYLHKKRLKKAMQLLEKGYSVKEVAAETGYHVSHFISMFRDYFGVTPGSINRNK